MTTPHFIGLRHGFHSTLYIEHFTPFTTADFDWRLTDIAPSHKQMTAALLRGTPSAAVVAHLAVFATSATGMDSWRAHRWATLIGAQPGEYLRVEWNYAGCPNKQTKAARDAKAKAEMLALRATRPALEQKAVDAFNLRIADAIEQVNGDYLRGWHDAVTSGQRDAWVLSATGRTDEVAAYSALVEREEALAVSVQEARRALSALRDERHAAYQALARERLADAGWADNDKVPFPAELRTAIEKTLAESRREQIPFSD